MERLEKITKTSQPEIQSPSQDYISRTDKYEGVLITVQILQTGTSITTPLIYIVNT
jgi:hypothetical protein